MKVEDRRLFPLYHCQTALWSLERLAPGTTLYNMGCCFEIEGALDIARFRLALREIVDRHDALRTVFQETPAGPRQTVLERSGVDCPLVDFSTRSASAPPAGVDAAVAAEARIPFDLEKGPLFRFRLFRLNEKEHRLLTVIHHLVIDIRSMEICIAELMALYHGRVLPELPVRYRHFALRDTIRRERDTFLEHEAFWREHLGARPGGFAIPTDRPRPDGAVVLRARNLAHVLAPRLVGEMERFRQSRKTSHYRLVLAALCAHLYRVTGRREITLGIPLLGRIDPEVAHLVGFFVNTLPLCARVQGDLGFGELHARIHRTLGEVARHQDYPREKIRSSNLFSIVCTRYLQAWNREEGGLRISGDLVAREWTSFDLTVYSNMTQGGIRLMFEFGAALFDPTTIRRMARQFENLLGDLIREPEKPVDQLALLGEGERHQMLVEWNDPQAAARRPGSIVERFELRAAERPDAVALVCESEVVSYGELSRRCRRLARRLRRRGVGRETPVGVLMDRSIDLVVGFLGILEAGGVYVPLDPSQPKARLAFMVEDSGVEWILARQGEIRGPAAGRVPGPDAAGSAADLAYVMYTSGSTGRPKGVAVTQRGVVRLVRRADWAELSPRQIFLALAPPTFDASTLEIWGSLLNGGRLVIFPGRAFSLGELAEALERRRVSTLWLTAGLFHQLVDEEPAALAGVRQLLAGGDVLSAAHVRKVLGAHPGLRLINGYGPTENTTFTTCHPMRSAAEVGGSVPLGRPIARTRVVITDARLRLAPRGVAGELLTGGDGLARGYLARPARTAERFVPDPWSGRPGERLYRTGDRARYLADGRLEFLGRLDHQVKVRGYRVELGEIEAALAEHPRVRGVAVVARDEPGLAAGGRRLTACVVPSEGDAAGGLSAELRADLARRLPAYMVPSAFVALSALPRTLAGKIDRRALTRECEADGRTELEVPFAPPRTESERTVARAWRDVLGLERVGVHDNFFEVGGHSLGMMQIQARLCDSLDREVSLVEMFRHPTVHGLARHLVAEGGGISSRVRAERRVEGRRRGKARLASRLELRRGRIP